MVTTFDIAKAAGVSRGCVSQVLNRHPSARISPETRQRIWRIAQDLGYQVKAQSPARLRSDSIIYILGRSEHVEILDDPWHFHVLDELQRRCRADGRSVTFLSGPSSPGAIAEVSAVVQRSRPLGVILDGVVTQPLFDAVRARCDRVVVAGVTELTTDADEPPFNSVSVDIGECMRRLVRWLAQQGAKSIAFIKGNSTLALDQKLVDAYRQTVESLGLEYNPGLVQIFSRQEAGIGLISRYAQLGLDFDAVLFGDASLAHRSYISLGAWQRDRGRGGRGPLPAGFVGAIDLTSDLLRQMAACGCRCTTFSQILYDTIASEIGYARVKPRQVMAPAEFREGIIGPMI